MRILALVPARGGSKRISGKNAKALGGKPLILWSIDAVRGLDGICDTLVSTDDEALSALTKGAGALVPWLRPAALATDTATTAEVARHALDWYETDRGAVDGLLLLQPTSPFRTPAMITAGIDLFREHGRRPVLGVSPAPAHPMHCFRHVGDRLEPFLGGDASRFLIRTQDLPPAYVANGSFYLVSPDDLRNRGSFYGDDMVPLVDRDPRSAIDIDDESDCARAEVAANEVAGNP